MRDDAAPMMLFDMEMAINGIAADLPDHPSVVSLTNCYHNLIRRWADA